MAQRRKYGIDHDVSEDEVAVFNEVEFRVVAPHSNDGRSVGYSFSASPHYKRIIELIYSHPLVPWKTESDVMRAFVDDGVQKFGKVLGGKVLPGLLHSLEMMNRLVEQARQANDFADSIDQLDREVQRLVDGGMRESAVGLVYQYREQAKQMPHRILSRKLVSDINQRFAYLLKGNQGRKDGERGGWIGAEEDTV